MFLTADERLTWAQYDARSDRLAEQLLGLGLARAERMGVLLPDGPGVHVVYIAAEKAGLVVVGIGPRAGFRELEHLLKLTGATCLVSRAEHQGASMADWVGRARGQGLSLRHHRVVPESFDPAAEVTRRMGGVLEHRQLAHDDLFLLNSTSGTTGMPKCVRHEQRRWLEFHRYAVEAAELSSSDVFMSVLPTPFGFGLWSGHVTPTLLGVPTVLMSRFSADAALELIEKQRVTVLCAVSSQFIMLLNSPTFERYDLSSLRVMFTGGEAVPYAHAAGFEDRTGARVLQFYGSNEAGGLSRTMLSDSREKRLRTAGRVIPEMNVRLFDETGRDVTVTGRGQPGCRGPLMSSGYYGDEAANAALFRDDGWMLVGDLVEIDREGYLRVIGRTDDFVIRGGKNISSVGVEEQVATHPSVALAAAVAMPDPVLGERVCVYVELRPGRTLSLEELVAHLARREVSKEMFPERLVVLDALPRSSGGKVSKRELRADIARMLSAEREGQERGR